MEGAPDAGTIAPSESLPSRDERRFPRLRRYMPGHRSIHRADSIHPGPCGLRGGVRNVWPRPAMAETALKGQAAVSRSTGRVGSRSPKSAVTDRAQETGIARKEQRAPRTTSSALPP